MRFFILITFICLLIGCQTTNMSDDSSLQDDYFNTKPDYTGYQKSRKRLKEFKQSNVINVQDEYSTKRAQQIAKHLNDMDEINRSQVVETDDKIVAGVILNLHTHKQLGDRIEKEIRKFVDDEKEIIVYTDYTYWYRRIDDDATSGATRLGEDLESIFDQFFHIAD